MFVADVGCCDVYVKGTLLILDVFLLILVVLLLGCTLSSVFVMFV